jgi:hypothetical protein
MNPTFQDIMEIRENLPVLALMMNNKCQQFLMLLQAFQANNPHLSEVWNDTVICFHEIANIFINYAFLLFDSANLSFEMSDYTLELVEMQRELLMENRQNLRKINQILEEMVIIREKLKILYEEVQKTEGGYHTSVEYDQGE